MGFYGFQCTNVSSKLRVLQLCGFELRSWLGKILALIYSYLFYLGLKRKGERWTINVWGPPMGFRVLYFRVLLGFKTQLTITYAWFSLSLKMWTYSKLGSDIFFYISPLNFLHLFIVYIPFLYGGILKKNIKTNICKYFLYLGIYFTRFGCFCYLSSDMWTELDFVACTIKNIQIRLSRDRKALIQGPNWITS